MSSQRGLVQRIERKLEVSVGDAFARVFGGSIVPQEVEAMLRREAAEGIRPVAGDRLLAPNEYIITLGMHDYEKVGADLGLTSDGFAKHLARYIGEQGWQTYGDVVIRFEQSANLHTGQFRARGAVNPDVEPRPIAGEFAPRQSDHAFSAEPGVPAMSENSSYGGGQGQGRPGDDYYDDPHAHPHDDPHAAPDPRGGYQPEPGGYPEQRGGYPDQGGYPPQYEQRPAGGYGAPDQRGGYPEQGGYPDQRGGYPEQGGYPDQRGGHPDQGGYPPQYEQRPAGGYGAPDQRGGYPEQGGYPDQRGAYPDSARRPDSTAATPTKAATPPTSAAATPTKAATAHPTSAAPTPTRARATTRATPAADTADRTTASSPTTAGRTTARHTPRPVAAVGTPSPGTTTTTASPRRPAVTVPPTDNRAATRPRVRRSRCNSTTAAGAPISYVKARTSSAAARMPSSGCRTPVCRVAIWRFGGTATSRCCPTSTPPTAPPSTTHLFRSGSWPTAM